MTKEVEQKTIDLELDMYVEMRKYFLVDIQNITTFLNQLATVIRQLQQNPIPRNQQAIQANQITMGSLINRRNFATNCTSFLLKKINQWRKKKPT